MTSRTSHSEKGIKTIAAMGTVANDWHLTPLKWSWVNLIVPTEVSCPTCRGRGRTYVNLTTGKAATDATFENINDRAPDGWKSKNQLDACPGCSKSRSGSIPYSGSGKIIEYRNQEVLVATPVWAKGTLFDSRFRDQNRDSTPSGKDVLRICELCSKSITGRWSHRVPVQAKGADGRIHGMWIGEDCARKILGIEVALTADQKAELKKSVYKRFVVREESA